MLETLDVLHLKEIEFPYYDHQLKVYGYCSDCQTHMTPAELEKLDKMAHHA